VVEDARSLLAQAFLPLSIFDTYEFNPPNASDDDAGNAVTFEIELHALLTVLDIFGAVGSIPVMPVNGFRGKKGRWVGKENDEEYAEGAQGGGMQQYFMPTDKSGKLTGMRMTYIGEGHPISLTLSEDANGPVTTCNINTLEPEAHLELDFDDDEKLVQVIMKSSWLSEALSELDNSCDKLTVICSPPTQPLPFTSTVPSEADPARAERQSLVRDMGSRATLRLLGTSAYGSTEIDYPNDRDVLQTFECEDSVQFSYRFSHIAKISRALQGSRMASLRMNEEGVMSLQLMMPAVRGKESENATAFIEFRCLALSEDE